MRDGGNRLGSVAPTRWSLLIHYWPIERVMVNLSATL